MKTAELHKKIKVVLDEEKRAYAARGRKMGALGSMNIGTQSVPNLGWTNEGNIPSILFDTSSKDVIESPNANILLKLFSTLGKKEKNVFKKFLISCLHKDSEYASIGYFIFFVLYRLGFGTDALATSRAALAGDDQHGYSNVLCTLSMIISREYMYISVKTYEDIESILQGDTEHDFRLREKVNLAKLKHIAEELQDVNPEINSDRDKVIDLWGKKFTDTEIPVLITEIDDYFREGELSSTKFATCIGRIRVLLVEVAKKVALDIGGGTVNESSDDHHFFDHLKNKKHITTPEWNILRSIYDLASTDGAHALKSNREYARLVRNMAYEFVLLLLSRNIP